MRRTDRRWAVLAVGLALLGGCADHGQASAAAAMGPKAPAFPTGGVTWINSRPLTLKQLHGKVVLIDFWEYTCINCIRSFPFDKKLYRRYHRQGFELIGVHEPEFDIAYHVDNVRKAVKRFQLPYPVAHDKWFSIWKAYGSHTWPNYFLLGPEGHIAGHWSGEGHDAAIEKRLQELLKRINPKFDASKYPIAHRTLFGPGCGQMTEEMYAGDWYGRGALQGEGGYKKAVRAFKAIHKPADGRYVLNGQWETKKNGVTFHGAKQTVAPTPPAALSGRAAGMGYLTLRYHAREIYSVMNTASIHGKAVRVYITQDGRWLAKTIADADVQYDRKGRSFIEVADPRMYYLVLNAKDSGHELTLWPARPGLTVNSFTFGNNCTIDFPRLYSHAQKTGRLK